jgi:Mpv17 / PMP22 family
MLRPCLQRVPILRFRPCNGFCLPRRTNTARPRNFSTKEGADIKFLDSPLLWYSRKLDTHPIITKCISAGIISGLGNLGAQRLMHSQLPVSSALDDDETKATFTVDWHQMGRFMFLNVVFVAPVLHFWYVGLARAIPGTSLVPVLKRVFYDEFVFTPVYVPILMTILWSLEGVEPKHLPRMIREEWLTIMIFDWSVYVPVQFINFRYVPVKFQVLVINLVGVGWNCFVCWRAQGQQARQKEIKESELEEERKERQIVSLAS